MHEYVILTCRAGNLINPFPILRIKGFFLWPPYEIDFVSERCFLKGFVCVSTHLFSCWRWLCCCRDSASSLPSSAAPTVAPFVARRALYTVPQTTNLQQQSQKRTWVPVTRCTGHWTGFQLVQLKLVTGLALNTSTCRTTTQDLKDDG